MGRLRGSHLTSTLRPDLGNANVGISIISMGIAILGNSLFLLGKLFPLCKNNYLYQEDICMNASVAIQSLPAARDDEELIRIVDEVIAYIKSTGYNYYVGPFETTIEGDYDALMDIVKECQHIAIRAGAPSVAAYIKVSYKPEGDVLTIEKKVSKHHQ